MEFFINRTHGAGDGRLCNGSENLLDLTALTKSYVLFASFVVLSILTMCGNLLVIIAIIYFKQLHTATNYLILSLAVADLLVGVFILPFTAVHSLNSCLSYHDFLCKIRVSFDRVLCTCSILHLCFISIDRYYAVCQPLRYKTKINACVSVIMILLSWSVSALTSLGIIILEEKKGQPDRKCALTRTSRSSPIGLVFAFYLPVLIMSAIYLKIFLVAQRQARSIQNTQQTTKPGAAVSKTERKATKTLAVVMGVFLLCWTPFFLCNTFLPLIDYTAPVEVIETFKCLGWSNSMLNPFVYGFFYSWFRLAFKMIITGKIFCGNYTNKKLF